MTAESFQQFEKEYLLFPDTPDGGDYIGPGGLVGNIDIFLEALKFMKTPLKGGKPFGKTYGRPLKMDYPFGTFSGYTFDIQALGAEGAPDLGGAEALALSVGFG